MFEPCYEHCYLKYGKEYTKECDDKCMYAKAVKNNMCKDERIDTALDLAWEYAQIDGSHHKMWVIDQMVRVLCGSEEEYEKWVGEYTKPIRDGDYYPWDTGIAP